MLRQLSLTIPISYICVQDYSAQTDEAMLGIALSAPASARMHQVQAHQLARQGVKDDAIAHYREALKIDPRLPGAHFELAELLAAVPDEEGSLKEYQAALAVDPYDAKSECRLGQSAFVRLTLRLPPSTFHERSSCGRMTSMPFLAGESPDRHGSAGESAAASRTSCQSGAVR